MKISLALAGTVALVVVSLTGILTAQVERVTYRIDVPSEWVLTPTEYPCLTESIHVSGTFQEYFNLVFTPGSIAHATLHQTTDNLTAVGLTTGEIYHNSGPLTQTAMGSAERCKH